MAWHTAKGCIGLALLFLVSIPIGQALADDRCGPAGCGNAPGGPAAAPSAPASKPSDGATRPEGRAGNGAHAPGGNSAPASRPEAAAPASAPGGRPVSSLPVDKPEGRTGGPAHVSGGPAAQMPRPEGREERPNHMPAAPAAPEHERRDSRGDAAAAAIVGGVLHALVGPPPHEGYAEPVHHRFHHHEARLFPPDELVLWQQGYWDHGWHGGVFGWWFFADGVWYLYNDPIYPYPPFVSETVVSDYVPPGFSDPSAQQYWYYCDNPAGYYPYVQNCSGPFRPVPATPR